MQIGGKTYDLEADGGLRIDNEDGGVSCLAGVFVLGSVTDVALNRT